MTQDLAIFNYEGNQQVRAIEIDGCSWFVGSDVCNILGVDSTQVRRLDDEEKGMHTIQTPGGNQQMTIINESGLYSLILTSRKETAKQFKKWVTAEVIPSIRKTGQYSVRPEIQLANAVILAQGIIEDQNRLITEMIPKAQFFDAVTDSTTAVDIGTVAKVLNCGIGRTRLFEFLRDENILMGNNQPYQRYIDSGYFRIIETSYGKPDGSNHVNFKTVVYQKGVDYIRRKLAESKQRVAA